MIRFFCPGEPAPQGSKRAYRRGSKIALVEDSKKSRPWRSDVKVAAMAAMGDRPLFEGAVWMSLVFVFPRPKHHYGTGRNAGTLSKRAESFVRKKPDRDKLHRCVCDALTGVVWKDDSQDAAGPIFKVYGDRPGVWVEIREARVEDLPHVDA